MSRKKLEMVGETKRSNSFLLQLRKKVFSKIFDILVKILSVSYANTSDEGLETGLETYFQGLGLGLGLGLLVAVSALV